MADTARTFIMTETGLKPVSPPQRIGTLDVTGVPSNAQVGKITMPQMPVRPSTTSTITVYNTKPTPVEKPKKSKKKKKLIPLDEWNRRRSMCAAAEPKPNGIACPKCGGELYDSLQPAYSNLNGTYVQVFCDGGDYWGERRT